VKNHFKVEASVMVLLVAIRVIVAEVQFIFLPTRSRRPKTGH
jgi:hypothetical protein